MRISVLLICTVLVAGCQHMPGAPYGAVWAPLHQDVRQAEQDFRWYQRNLPSRDYGRTCFVDRVSNQVGCY